MSRLTKVVKSLLLALLLFFSESSLAQDFCPPVPQSVADTAQELINNMQSAQKLTVECIEQELVDVFLDPYQLQSVAMKLCAEEAECLEFLKSEAVRVSRQPPERFEKMTSVGLWSEITKYSGFNRIRPPMLSDLPLKKSPSEVFEKLKQARLSDRELNKNEILSVACAALAAMVGPGKAKVLTVAKQASKVYKIQHSKEVTKLIEKNRLPQNVKDKFMKWASDVEKKGLEEVRKIGGYHDESLRSMPNRRSVRVGDGFRACYETAVEKGVVILKIITISSDHRDSAYCR